MENRMCWAVLAFLSLSVLAFGLDFMGPPTATLKQGQWKTDFTYFHSENDAQFDEPILEDLGLENIDDLELQRYYATFGYGLDDRVEIYAKLGGVDAEQEDAGFDSSADLAYGWGTRITTNKSKEVDWGVGFLMSWLRADESYSLTADDLDYEGDLEFDAYELQVAAGPTFKFRGWKLYGGVFFYMLEGDLDGDASVYDGGILTDTASGSADIEADSNVGGYIGTVMHLTKNIDAMVEVAAISDGWGLGGNIAWKF